MLRCKFTPMEFETLMVTPKSLSEHCVNLLRWSLRHATYSTTSNSVFCVNLLRWSFKPGVGIPAKLIKFSANLRKIAHKTSLS